MADNPPDLSSTLSAFSEEDLELMTPQERLIVEEAARRALEPPAVPLWIPHEGPQTMAYESEADELFYGGAAGGGKSALGIGLAITRHQNSLILRRQASNVVELVSQIKRFAGRDGFRGSGHGGNMTTNDGRVIELSGCEHEDDKQKYAGRPHDFICVGKGTSISMGDGSFKAVENIKIGDWVETLEGPKRVIQKHPPQLKEAIRLDILNEDGSIKCSQIQSQTHSVLTTQGWIPLYNLPTNPSSDKGFYVPYKWHGQPTPNTLDFGQSLLEIFPSFSIYESEIQLQDWIGWVCHFYKEFSNLLLWASFERLFLDKEFHAAYKCKLWCLMSDLKRKQFALKRSPFQVPIEYNLELLDYLKYVFLYKFYAVPPLCFYVPILYHVFYTKFLDYPLLKACPKEHQLFSCIYLEPKLKLLQSILDYHNLESFWVSCRALINHRSDYEESVHYNEVKQQLYLRSLFFQERLLLVLLLKEMAVLSHSFVDDVSNVEFGSLLLSYLDDCLFLFHQYGEHNQTGVCQDLDAKDVLVYLRQPTTPVEPSQTYYEDDGRDNTPKHIHHTEYVHPYTKDIRHTSALLKPCAFSITPVGKQIVYDLAVEDVQHYITKDGIINKNCFDEAPQFSRSIVKFISAWNRSSDPNQRCRIVLTGNPPTSPEGRWVIEEFAPWLDSEFEDPAKPGELRWYTVLIDERGEGILTWFRSGVPIFHNGEKILPRSRTFIPALLKDNPILSKTAYASVLQALEEPLRSQLLYGDMTAGMEDDSWQVIPSAWVRAAVARWSPKEPCAQDALGVDVSRGGRDKTVIAARHGNWFAKLLKYPGQQVPDGDEAASLVIKAHKGEAPVFIDVIGIGASAYDCLKKCRWFDTYPVNNAMSSPLRDRSKRFGFRNIRAASYWKLREALDPENGEAIALPPDNELIADLCAPRYRVTPSGYQVESKEDIKKRIGRSTDCADAVVLAYWGICQTQPLMRIYSLRTIEKKQQLKIVVCHVDELPQVMIEDSGLLITIQDPPKENNQETPLLTTAKAISKELKEVLPEAARDEKTNDALHAALANICICGGEKTKTPHSDWCPKSQANVEERKQEERKQSKALVPYQPIVHGMDRMADCLRLVFTDLDPRDIQQHWNEPVEPWGKTPAELVMSREDGKKIWAMITKKRPEPVNIWIIADEGGDRSRAMSIAMGLCDLLRFPREKTIHLLGEDEEKHLGPAPNKHIYTLVKEARTAVL